MDALKLVAPFQVTAELSDRLRSISAAMAVFIENSERLTQMGERVSQWDKKIRAQTAVLSGRVATPFGNHGSSAQATSGSLVGTVQLPPLAAEAPKQIAQTLGWRGGVAFQTYSSLAELLSAVGAAKQMGSVGPGTMFAHEVREVLKWSESKSPVDVSHKLAERLTEIGANVEGRSPAKKLDTRKQLGASNRPTIGFLTGHAAHVVDILKQSGRGILGHAYASERDKASDAAGRWQSSVSNLYDLASSRTVRPFAGKGAQILSSGIDWERGAPRVTHSFERLKSFCNTLGIPNGFGRLPIVPRGMSFASLAPELAKWLDIRFTERLGLIGIKINQHSGALTNCSAKLWDCMKLVTFEMTTSSRDAILPGSEWPTKDPDPLAKISGHFRFHSPPPFAPRGDALFNLKLGQGLGQRIKPAPVVSAVHRTPTASSASARMTPHSAAPINIKYAPVINGLGLDEHQLLRMLERHAYELHRIISRQEERRERLAFT